MKKLPNLVFLYIILGCASAPDIKAQVKQTPEAVEAYRVCRQFQQLLGESLDFERAYEATFTKNAARRRAIAIADGEFGSAADLKQVSTELLVKAYKQRMQIFYLVLILSGANQDDTIMPMPPEIETIVRRESPKDARKFSVYVSHLERDAAFLRSFIKRLTIENPAFAQNVRQFKAEIFSEKFEPPLDYKVEPNRGYYRSGVLNGNVDYYKIDSYSLVKEQGRMRIIGIRFFTRLF